MSNTKWVKLIDILVENASIIKSAKVKLVWDSDIRDFIFHENSSYNFNYYDTSVEGMVSGQPKGFYEYKEFEWLEIPRKTSVLIEENNLKAGSRIFFHDFDQIQKLLKDAGEFEIEVRSEALRLIAYR